jgi:hemerythrin superfamily protein
VTTTPSERDVVDILTTDHNELMDLLGQIKTTTDPNRRRDMADTITAELVRHSAAEEMFVYPAIKEHLPDGEQVVEHDTQEHKQIERTLKDLEGVEATDPKFMELLGRLEELLRDHVSDEENEQFPRLRQRVPREKLVEIGAKVENAKKITPTRPHPSAPNAKLFHMLVGPGVGLVDRLRDKLSGRKTS